MRLALLALLSAAVFVAMPFLAARGLRLIAMPLLVRLSVIALVPASLLWWLGTSPEFRDVTNPGAAVIPLLLMFGWLLGSGWSCVVRLACSVCTDTRSDELIRDHRSRIGR